MLLNWDKIRAENNITGVIHVGAYAGEERKDYKDLPVKWVEADPTLIPALIDKGLDVYHFAAYSEDGWIDFNVMEFKPANSILEPKLNMRRKDVRVLDRIKVPCMRLENIQEEDFNTIVMDIQGGELEALKGCDLSQISYLLLEVHKVETYENVPQIEDITAYLKDFDLVEAVWVKFGWGEAFYKRKQ